MTGKLNAFRCQTCAALVDARRERVARPPWQASQPSGGPTGVHPIRRSSDISRFLGVYLARSEQPLLLNNAAAAMREHGAAAALSSAPVSLPPRRLLSPYRAMYTAPLLRKDCTAYFLRYRTSHRLYSGLSLARISWRADAWYAATTLPRCRLDAITRHLRDVTLRAIFTCLTLLLFCAGVNAV